MTEETGRVRVDEVMAHENDRKGSRKRQETTERGRKSERKVWISLAKGERYLEE